MSAFAILAADDLRSDQPAAAGPASPSDDELLDAYSRTVSGVVERLAPAVVSVGVQHPRKSRGGASPGGEGARPGVGLSPGGVCFPHTPIAPPAAEKQRPVFPRPRPPAPR